MKDNPKLFKVVVKGPSLGPYFVVATEPTRAYDIVKSFLDEKDYGFSRGRELDSITLVAETIEGMCEAQSTLLIDNG